jgi:hypothetical protein
MTRWTHEQVTRLAPGPPSLSSAPRRETVLVLISDLYEGGIAQALTGTG